MTVPVLSGEDGVSIPVSCVERAGTGHVHRLADVEDPAVVGFVGVVAVWPALAPENRRTQTSQRHGAEMTDGLHG